MTGTGTASAARIAPTSVCASLRGSNRFCEQAARSHLVLVLSQFRSECGSFRNVRRKGSTATSRRGQPSEFIHGCLNRRRRMRLRNTKARLAAYALRSPLTFSPRLKGQRGTSLSRERGSIATLERGAPDARPPSERLLIIRPADLPQSRRDASGQAINTKL